MDKSQRRTITPVGTLLGWRRLHPDHMAYSGLLVLFKRMEIWHRKKRGWIPWLEFDFITHHPASTEWEEHYLGEKKGFHITLLIKNASQQGNKQCSIRGV